MEIIITKSEDSDHTKSKYELRRTDPNQLLKSEVRFQVSLITNYKPQQTNQGILLHYQLPSHNYDCNAMQLEAVKSCRLTTPNIPYTTEIVTKMQRPTIYC